MLQYGELKLCGFWTTLYYDIVYQFSDEILVLSCGVVREICSRQTYRQLIATRRTATGTE